MSSKQVSDELIEMFIDHHAECGGEITEDDA